MKTAATIVTALSCCASLQGENLIRSLLNKVRTHKTATTNIPKVDIGNGFYYYTLKDIKPTESKPTEIDLVPVESKIVPGHTYFTPRETIVRKYYPPRETVMTSVPVNVEHVPMTPSEIETARVAIAELNEELKQQSATNHPDNVPVKDVINKHEETKEAANTAVKQEIATLYGEGSPLQDQEVVSAWSEYEQAKKRLEDHREYMEKVRKSRKNVEQSKRATTGITD